MTHLTLRQLRYFLEIARCGSLSRAAEQLRVAQPALSQNLAALEDTLGERLFERHARGVSLSAAGQRLAERAPALLAEVDGLADVVQGRSVRPRGVVRVSLAGTLAPVVIAPLLQQLAASHPGIELAVVDGLSPASVLQVESGQVHLALTPGATELQGMQALPVLHERLVLVGAAEAMRALPAEVTLAEALARPLAAPDRAHHLRKLIEREAAARGLVADVRHELNSPPMLIALVRAGLAHAILPASLCQDALDAGTLAARRIVAPELLRTQAVVWRQGHPLPPAAEVVREALVEVLAALVASGALDGRLP